MKTSKEKIINDSRIYQMAQFLFYAEDELLNLYENSDEGAKRVLKKSIDKLHESSYALSFYASEKREEYLEEEC